MYVVEWGVSPWFWYCEVHQSKPTIKRSRLSISALVTVNRTEGNKVKVVDIPNKLDVNEENNFRYILSSHNSGITRCGVTMKLCVVFFKLFVTGTLSSTMVLKMCFL